MLAFHLRNYSAVAGAVAGDGGVLKASVGDRLLNIQCKVFIQIRLRALKQCQDVRRHLSVDFGFGIHVHERQVSSGAEEASGFLQDGDRGTLG